MITSEVLARCYYQQGYNYRENTPTGETALGGGCQSSALLMALRILRNTDISMRQVSEWVQSVGLTCVDKLYSARIAYPAIPIVLARLCPQHTITLMHQQPLQAISFNQQSPFFTRESNQTYRNMPSMPNLNAKFGVDAQRQTSHILEVLSAGGIAVVLIHLNTFLGLTDDKTDSWIHAVVLSDYNSHQRQFSVIDPEPGFYTLEMFREQANRKQLRIRGNRLNFIQSQQLAARLHPLKSISYTVSQDTLARALRFTTTMAVPAQG